MPNRLERQYARLAAAVVDADDAIVRYTATRYLDGADPTSAEMLRLRNDIAGSTSLTRAGYVTDPRCANALDLLESKLVPGEGWATERRLFNHAAGEEGFTHAPWDQLRLGRAHALLTIDALEILRRAGRW